MKKLKILGHDYEVKVERGYRKQSDAIGRMFADLCEIYVDADLKNSKQEEVLLHEIFEALKYHLGLEMEHKDIQSLSENLYSVLKRNDLIDFSRFID